MTILDKIVNGGSIGGSILDNFVKDCQGLSRTRRVPEMRIVGSDVRAWRAEQSAPVRTADFNHGAQKIRGLGTVWRWGARAGSLPAGAGAYPGQDPPPGCNIHPRHVARGLGAGVPRKRAAILACCVSDIWPCSPVCGLWGHKAVSMRRLQASWGPLTIRDNP